MSTNVNAFYIDSVSIDSIECIRNPCLVSTVLTNNIVYTIQCIGCFDLCIDSVNKQHSIHYSMHWVLFNAFDLCIDSVNKQHNLHYSMHCLL